VVTFQSLSCELHLIYHSFIKHFKMSGNIISLIQFVVSSCRRRKAIRMEYIV
jgi:hypothetical protein